MAEPPPLLQLTADDFEETSRGPRPTVWVARSRVKSPIGPFDLELDERPDAELLGEANDLVAAVSANVDTIRSLVYGSYLRVADDARWMKGCGVPAGLDEDEVAVYLRRRAIVVWRNRNRQVEGMIFLSPKWDVEHGIDLRWEGGRILRRG